MLAQKLQAQVRRVFGAKLKAWSGDAPSEDDEPAAVADASHRGDDLERCFEFRLAADDERRFERLLRRRVALFYWLLLVALRLFESSRYVTSGVGSHVSGAAWTALFVAASTAAATASPVTRAYCLARAHYALYAYLLTNHSLRLIRNATLDDAEREAEVARVASYLHHPLNYVVVLCHGVCLSLIFSRNVGFQVLYVCTNASLSVAVGRAAGANALDHYLAPLLAWAASVAAGNAFIFAVLKPTWVKAQRAGNPALERRVDELSREKARVAWEWQLDVARLDRDPEPGAVALPDAPDGTFLPKDAGGVALEGSPESLGDVDLGF